MNYAPLSKNAIRTIQFHDKKFYHGINRTRFYTWLVQVGSDVQIRHVAVKTGSYIKGGGRNAGKARVVKEVARFSVDDPEMHIKDLIFYHGGGGYAVDWRPEGLGYEGFPASYDGWESEDYKDTGLWHIRATVINPDLLSRTKRFRYCNWWSQCGDIVNYLKTYVQHPGLEMLSKMGLQDWCLKKAIYLKAEKDKAFAKFLFRNADDIRSCHYKIPSVLKAYKENRPIADVVDEKARKELEAKRVDNDKVAAMAEQWSWLEKIGRKYCIVLPREHLDFVKEGTGLNHCVLDERYAQKMARGQSIIAFVRMKSDKETPLVTVEYDLKKAQVTQCYGNRNSKPDKAIRDFVDRCFARAKKVELEVAA